MQISFKSPELTIGCSAALLLCAQFPAVVVAGHGLDIFEDDIPVVLSASRLIQPVSSSPASMTIIDAEMIELSGARTIVDLLRLVPGMQVGKLVNGNPVATYHGLSERYNPRLQLIVDGRPTYVPLYGGIPWSELPVALSDIQRIEVTRAPNAATFGPNSFAAVVSIITRAPASGSGWYVNTEAGGNEFRSGTLSYYKSGTDAAYRVTLQGERDEGFDNIPDKERSTLGSIRTHWQLNQTDRIGIDLGAVRGGHTELDTVVEENDIVGYVDTLNAYTQFVWERAHSSDDSWRVQYYYNHFDIKDSGVSTIDVFALTSNPDFAGLTLDVNVDRDSRSSRHDLEIQRTTRLNQKHRLVYGAGLREDAVRGRFLFGDNRKRNVSTQQVFAHSEFEPSEKWVLNSGLLLEHNSLSHFSASPRFSLSWKRMPGQQLRLGYSRGIRTPLLLEEEGVVEFNLEVSNGMQLVDQFIVNEDKLSSESIDVVDLGFYYDNPQHGLGIDTKLSYHEIRDVIAPQLTNNVETDTFDQLARVYRNRFDFRFSTFDIQLEYQQHSRFRLRAAYAYAFGADRSLSQRKLVPRHTLSLFGSLRVDRSVTATAEYYYTSGWIWDDVRDESRLNRLDLRLAKSIRLARLNAVAALQAEMDLGNSIDYLERNKIDNLYFARLTVQLP